MKLEKYNLKRDFKKTTEPQGINKKSKGQLHFVVQKHAASHLHYDFRLEIDGVLVSWAVPKGPSVNPSERRLAIQTEDHPMNYIDFEGTIPKGEYGAGTVMVWDAGAYHAEGNSDVSKDNVLMKKQLESGSIKVILEGTKLKGSWHLVLMKGEERQWLLIKGKDEYANAITEFNPDSVATGRDLETIAKENTVFENNDLSHEKKK